MWTLHKQSQHCGAQLPTRAGTPRQSGEAPDAATRDRAAQEHDRAGDQSLQPGDYPASPIENRRGDTAPTAAGDTRVAWDDVVQPEQQLTELEQDERGEDVERAIELDEDEDERDAGEGPDA